MSSIVQRTSWRRPPAAGFWQLAFIELDAAELRTPAEWGSPFMAAAAFQAALIFAYAE